MPQCPHANASRPSYKDDFLTAAPFVVLLPSIFTSRTIIEYECRKGNKLMARHKKVIVFRYSSIFLITPLAAILRPSLTSGDKRWKISYCSPGKYTRRSLESHQAENLGNRCKRLSSNTILGASVYVGTMKIRFIKSVSQKSTLGIKLIRQEL